MSASRLVSTAWTTGSSAAYSFCAWYGGSGFSFSVARPSVYGWKFRSFTLTYGLIAASISVCRLLSKTGSVGTPTADFGSPESALACSAAMSVLYCGLA